MNKRFVAATLTAVLMTAMTAGAADAGKKKRVERTASEDYIGATGPRGAADTPCVTAPVGCVKFALEPTDRFVSIDIVDSAGDPIWASIYIYGYTDGSDTHEHICGSTEAPLPIAKGVEELVVVTTQTTGGATSPCLGPATTGTVTATFSNLR